MSRAGVAMHDEIRGGAIILSLALLAGGAGLVYLPAAPIVAGLVLLVLAIKPPRLGGPVK